MFENLQPRLRQFLEILLVFCSFSSSGRSLYDHWSSEFRNDSLIIQRTKKIPHIRRSFVTTITGTKEFRELPSWSFWLPIHTAAANLHKAGKIQKRLHDNYAGIKKKKRDEQEEQASKRKKKTRCPRPKAEKECANNNNNNNGKQNTAGKVAMKRRRTRDERRSD
jgi:hypothetical protein